MKRTMITAGLILAFVIGGCATSTCKKICECSDGDEDECVDDCKEDYKDGNSDCKKAMRDFGDCLDDDGCSSDSCTGEAIDVADDCDLDIY